MCMYCACKLDDEDFQPVTVQIGNRGVDSLYQPVCAYDQPSQSEVLYPDGRSRTIDALGGATSPAIALAFGIAGYIARESESVSATFTFHDVHRKFAKELDYLRNLSAEEYEDMMDEANAKFLAKLHGNKKPDPKAEEVKAKKAEQQAQDAAMFGVDDAKPPAPPPPTRNRMLLMGVIGVSLAVTLVAAAFGVYLALPKPPLGPEPEPIQPVKVKPANPGRETKAKIKSIDKGEGTIKFLVGDGKYQVYRISKETEFVDGNGNPLPQGIADPALREESYCVIALTDDRKALQWLKLAPPP